MNNFYFKEEQKFSIYLRILISIVTVCTLIGIFYMIIRGNEGQQESTIALVITVVALSIANFVIHSFKIISKADEHQFLVKVKPFGVTKKIRWEDMDEVDVRSFKNFRSFPGGWGIRYRLNGDVYYIAKGFQSINFKNKKGKNIVVGTSNLKEAEQLVNQWKNKYGSTKT